VSVNELPAAVHVLVLTGVSLDDVESALYHSHRPESGIVLILNALSVFCSLAVDFFSTTVVILGTSFIHSSHSLLVCLSLAALRLLLESC